MLTVDLEIKSTEASAWVGNSLRLETSFAGLTLEQHIGFVRKATMEAPPEVEMFKVRAIAARF